MHTTQERYYQKRTKTSTMTLCSEIPISLMSQDYLLWSSVPPETFTFLCKKVGGSWVLVPHNCNPSTCEAEARGPRVPGQLAFMVKFYLQQNNYQQNSSPEWRNRNTTFGNYWQFQGPKLRKCRWWVHCWLHLESLQDSPPPGRLSYEFIKVFGNMTWGYSEKQGWD